MENSLDTKSQSQNLKKNNHIYIYISSLEFKDEVNMIYFSYFISGLLYLSSRDSINNSDASCHNRNNIYFLSLNVIENCLNTSDIPINQIFIKNVTFRPNKIFSIDPDGWPKLYNSNKIYDIDFAKHHSSLTILHDANINDNSDVLIDNKNDTKLDDNPDVDIHYENDQKQGYTALSKSFCNFSGLNDRKNLGLLDAKLVLCNLKSFIFTKFWYSSANLAEIGLLD
ncbi:hypothetical protein BpHYR1_005331 [Brachionus plicatilis]|uniref:Uncharacterized protein n=1 Tax=Brachionus plicatilis TaxID=10195 RepID=A0A3M7RV23_BRAPC|nr:hypothetical protein BpHYR1_005331 [Brachionus plicatilis]